MLQCNYIGRAPLVLLALPLICPISFAALYRESVTVRPVLLTEKWDPLAEASSMDGIEVAYHPNILCQMCRRLHNDLGLLVKVKESSKNAASSNGARCLWKYSSICSAQHFAQLCFVTVHCNRWSNDLLFCRLTWSACACGPCFGKCMSRSCNMHVPMCGMDSYTCKHTHTETRTCSMTYSLKYARFLSTSMAVNAITFKNFMCFTCSGLMIVSQPHSNWVGLWHKRKEVKALH